MNRPNRQLRPQARNNRGYILVALLLLVGAMASIAATYSRHVIVRAHSTTVDSSFADAQELASSQIEFVVQSNRAGVPVNSSKILNALQTEAAHHTTSLAVGDLADDNLRVGLQALAADGMGVTRLLEVERIATPKNLDPATLPLLSASARSDLMAKGVAVYSYSTSTVISDTVLNGLVVVRSGAKLTLQNVIVTGAIVSGLALETSPPGAFDSISAPIVDINGNTRILASDTVLPGLAILMPDGVFTTSNPDARVQIVGDVVAHDFTLGCPASISGRLAVVTPPVMHVAVEHIGANRGPVPWSPVLDTHGVFEPVSVAFVPRPLSINDFSDLTSATLPAVK